MKYIDSGHLRINGKVSAFPEGVNSRTDVLILIDDNGHFSLSYGMKELHGRVLNAPISVVQVREGTHKKQVIIKLKGLREDELAILQDAMLAVEGKRSLSCLNALEYVLFESLGISTLATRQAESIHPKFEEIIAKPWVREDGSRIETEVYKFTERSMAEVVARAYKLEKVLEVGKPLTAYGWLMVSLKPESLVQFHPKVAESVRAQELDLLLPPELRALKKLEKIDRFKNTFKTFWNWIHSTVHNAGGAYHVVKFLTFKKMKHGLIAEDHPWVTGISPHTGRAIYPDNIVFRSESTDSFLKAPEPDDAIVSKVGGFMASMTKRSTGPQELEHGPKRRMPHVVNYLHGDVSFNGATLIFNNFKDAMFHLSDPKFVKEIYRFSKETGREFLIVLRERDYDPAEYAVFLGFVRSTLKWYANANGPKTRVLYGAPSPYPVINVINGSWVRSMKSLDAGKFEALVKPPIEKGRYFNSTYQGNRDHYNFLEAALAYFNYLVLKPRGFQGGYVFTLRKKIEPRQYEDYMKAVESGETPEMIAPVYNPFDFIRKQREAE